MTSANACMLCVQNHGCSGAGDRQRRALPETSGVHYALHFGFIFGLCIFGNLLLLPFFFHNLHIQSCDFGTVTHSLTS